MIQAAVFDLDGTLADTPPAIARLLVKVASEQGRELTTADVAPTIGKPLDTSLAALLGVPVDDPATDVAVARYRELFAGEVLAQGRQLLYPRVAEGLSALRKSGLVLAIATSKISRSAEALLSATGIRDMFGVVVCHDMVSEGKPHPRMGWRAAAELELEPSQCAYIGDTTTDMEMARAAGMPPVAVSYGVGGPELAGSVPPGTPVCDSFEAVVNALTAMATAPAPPVDAVGVPSDLP